MLVSTLSPDAASRAALRSLMERLPGITAVEGGVNRVRITDLGGIKDHERGTFVQRTVE